MKAEIDKYMLKGIAAGLFEGDEVVISARDDEFFWSRKVQNPDFWVRLFEKMPVTAFIIGRPAKKMGAIIEYLSKHEKSPFVPNDSETRTFLHDLHVAKDSSEEELVFHLSRRKAVILPGGQVATFGVFSVEEAFATYSSVCFACYVKFFSDCFFKKTAGQLDSITQALLEQSLSEVQVPPDIRHYDSLEAFTSETAICSAISKAGKIIVQERLVDSIFGNISVFSNNNIYISQTGAALDELEGCIDVCPADESSCAGITASSELIAHMGIYKNSDANLIIHGHPRFSVILSLACEKTDCPFLGMCHVNCPYNRCIEDIPIVKGEVGAGQNGLYKTVPRAIKEARGVIVLGHGLFVSGKDDFLEALKNMFEIEKMCINIFFKKFAK